MRSEREGHHLIPDLLLECVGRSLSDDLAFVDDRHVVGQLVGLLQVLGGEEDGHSQL